eukprot:scaffold1742_cov93-Cylindrotheca_fusiformis.AAC.1
MMKQYKYQLLSTLCEVITLINLSFLLLLLDHEDEQDDLCEDEGRRHDERRVLVQRSRTANDDWVNKVNAKLFRRLYRMDKESFLSLLKMISPLIERKNVPHKRKRGGSAPNGMIPDSQRLAMAIRYFAGGDPLDIAQCHPPLFNIIIATTINTTTTKFRIDC